MRRHVSASTSSRSAAELVAQHGPAFERRDHDFDLAPLVEQAVDLDQHRVDFQPNFGLPTAESRSATNRNAAARVAGDDETDVDHARQRVPGRR